MPLNAPDDLPQSMPPIDHAWIAARIPHQGAMCLLDRVTSWDAGRIECRAVSHLALDNPLRSRGRLAVVCGIEYAAQAMAVHGALTALAAQAMEVEMEPGSRGQRESSGKSPTPATLRPRAGYLTSVRNVQAHLERLDTLDAPLTIEAVLLHGDDNHIMYAFALSCESQPVLSGRASVILDADQHAGFPEIRA